jgi:dipeptidyl aminopeptidase/acylaminoacyl peptidase
MSVTSRAETWQEVADFAEARLAPTFGRAVSATSPALHPSRDVVAAVAEVRDALLAPARSVITLFGGGTETPVREGRMPVWSPDGCLLAHLDDDGVWIGELHRPLTGTTERLAWNGAGTALLVLVADAGSHRSGAAGSGQVAGEQDAWLPSVDSNLRHAGWRRLVVLDARTGEVRSVGRDDLNVWDACWAGERLLAVCSEGDPGESAWYTADLRLLDGVTGEDTVIARPSDQVGAVAASPSGRWVAFVEAVCSDRDIVAGDLTLLDTTTGEIRRKVDDTDVATVAFVDEEEIGFTGLRGMTTRIGLVSTAGEARVLWESEELSTVGTYPTAAFRRGAFASVRMGNHVPPHLVLQPEGSPEVVLAPMCRDLVAPPEVTSRVHRWAAPDGLEIEGWLHLPEGEGPHPLVVFVHGGPVYSWRSSWSALALLRARLLDRGYGLLLPNPRGSSGRGQDFARAVIGDMGGADAQDVLAGVASLADAGLVDRDRIGLTGGSYGGFMSAWLVTQTELFAAAVSHHPITDWSHQHGCSNLAYWDEWFLDGKPYARDGQYVERSPLTHAARVTTPTLFVAGTQDRSTPPGQALAMQRALASRGVPSECVTYPLMGHGGLDPAPVVDVAARTLEWFERWMPAGAAGRV